MYKVVNVADLAKATNFIETDKVIEINSSRTKMNVAKNDYAHKCKSYLSKSVNSTESAFNSYLQAIDKVNSTYFTKNLSDVYLPNGSLIKEKTLNTILSSDAFLTKEGCKDFETACIAYINELKNKAVSIIMAQLNRAFIKQNSAGKLSYGQIKLSNSSYGVSYTADITQLEDSTVTSYDFKTGEFSLGYLLFGKEVLNKTKKNSQIIAFNPLDAWTPYYSIPGKSYAFTDDAETILKDNLKNELLFNSKKNDNDYKIYVPEASFDYAKNKTIPIAKLIQGILKRQIEKVITNVCNNYISKMTSVPTIEKTANQ